jgi:hypothetical protein
MASPHLHSMFHMASGADPNSWRAGAIGSGTHSTFVAASELAVGHRSIDLPQTVAVAASTKRSTTKQMSMLLPQHKHIVIPLIVVVDSVGRNCEYCAHFAIDLVVDRAGRGELQICASMCIKAGVGMCSRVQQRRCHSLLVYAAVVDGFEAPGT